MSLASNAAPGAPVRLSGLDMLRGLAIIWVVLFHLLGFTTHGFRFSPPESLLLRQTADHVRDGQLWWAFTSAWEVVFRSGLDGVTWFIMLSGTALTIMALRRGSNVRPLEFYVRRIGRML